MELTDRQDIELDLFVTALRRRHGYDFAGYARASLKRRVIALAAHYGLPDISTLTGQVIHDQIAPGEVIGRLSVPVSEMFRDPTIFATLRREVLPVLASYPRIRIWHAGCAGGEEVYSMAVMLAEEGLYDRAQIYATDISDTVLERAREGIYDLAEAKDYDDNYARAGGKARFSDYFTTRYGHIKVAEALKRNITFANHNLVSDGVFCEVQLLMCRNVLIYFNDALKTKVLGIFRDSLTRRGFLCLGSRESLHGLPAEAEFSVVSEEARIFQRGRHAV